MEELRLAFGDQLEIICMLVCMGMTASFLISELELSQ